MSTEVDNLSSWLDNCLVNCPINWTLCPVDWTLCLVNWTSCPLQWTRQKTTKNGKKRCLNSWNQLLTTNLKHLFETVCPLQWTKMSNSSEPYSTVIIEAYNWSPFCIVTSEAIVLWPPRQLLDCADQSAPIFDHNFASADQSAPLLRHIYWPLTNQSATFVLNRWGSAILRHRIFELVFPRKLPK